MNFKSTLIKSFIFTLLFAFAGSTYAQIFWTEDFSGGIPSGWTNEDQSTNNALWTWCGDPLGGAGCSPLFDDQINMQSPFAATSSDNGFVTLNSDLYFAQVSNPHMSELTSTAIDCSAQPEVFIRFESHIGVFDLDADMNALLRVSNNGTDWTDYNCFPGLTTGVRWSENPEETIFDISAVAGGQSTVYLQWHWTGAWEYFWNLDDVTLHTENPLAPHDMRVNSNWFAIAPNAVTPVNQIETFGFMADVENVGLLDQTNVNLNVTIVNDADPGTILYDQTLSYGTIASDSLAENQLFPDAGFTPAPEVASYTGTYIVTSDSTDLIPDNNMQTFGFGISENVFAKDNGITTTISPATSNWDDTEAYSWAYGNHYYVVNGTGWWANEVTFGLGNASEVPGESIILYLYEWTDTNGDGDADPDERVRVGYQPYAIIGTETTTDLITLPLLDLATDEQGVSLKDNTHYILTIEYNATDQTQVVFLGCGNLDYGAQIFRSEELGQPRYAAMLGINEPLGTEPFSSLGFGWDIVPIARMHITDDLGVSVNALLSDDNIVEVFPSPAQDYINVSLDMVDLQPQLTLQLLDASGKLISQREYENVQKDQYRFDLDQLPAGNYFMNVNTPNGSKNMPFVIQR